MKQKLQHNTYNADTIFKYIWHYASDILYKTFVSAKPLLVWFEKLDEFIKIYDAITYLVLFAFGRYDAVYNGTKYLKKSGIKSSVNHYFVRVRIYSNFPLPVEKILTFHNVITSLSQLLIRMKITTTKIFF